MMPKHYIVGIDEVGRGSLAGPVAVVAALIPENLKIRVKKLGTLKDSKKLSPALREKWFNFFQNHNAIKYAIARVYPKKIDEINISRAANLAAIRAFYRLKRNHQLKSNTTDIFLDGGLFLGNSKKKPLSKTIIRGDEKINAIKIASIIAKVTRDRQMRRLAKKYPQYSLEVHKGYGTQTHLASIKKFGPSDIHRKTFINLS